MTQTLNQFVQNAVQGMLDLFRAKNVTACEIHSTEAGSLVAGQAVKRVNEAGGLPKVIACTSDADEVWGYIVYNVRNASFVAGDEVEVGTGFDDVMYMTAAAAIDVSALVMPVIASKKVTTATAGKPISGYALDKALADGDLIRVIMTLPAKFNA